VPEAEEFLASFEIVEAPAISAQIPITPMGGMGKRPELLMDGLGIDAC